MSSSIVRGKHVITRALDRHRCEQIDDGAVLQRDGTIVAIGPFSELRAANPDVPVIGDGGQALLPGFVNGHHHVGLTPVQLGSPDMPLELWFATRLVTRDLDLYLDTLYSAFEMIASGITTVQHIHGWMPGKIAAGRGQARTTSSAPTRTSACACPIASRCAIRTTSSTKPNDEFLARLPEAAAGPREALFDRFNVGQRRDVALRASHATHHNKSASRSSLRPPICIGARTEALTMLAEMLGKYGVSLHMHLVETAYQKEYARRRGDGTARRLRRALRHARTEI